MEATRDDLMQALREAGETLVREHHEATGEVPTHLADEVTLQGDIDHLDDVARDHGLEGGMPDGYSRPLADEWRAVFEGTREALDDLEIVGVDETADAARPDEIVERLNDYSGDNIWEDVIYDYEDEIDWERTDGELDAERYSDAFALRDGSIVRYNRSEDLWSREPAG